MELAQDFSFKPLSNDSALIHFPFPEIANPLGPLQNLPGTWTGKGFNTIWRPHFTGQDRFLELNLTTETLQFDVISGPIPNRGLLQADINMFGVHYLQQIKDASASTGFAGLHIEPGIWATVPSTTQPAEPPTVVRMASIPHGTTILAQGTSLSVNGPPKLDPVDIIPFPIGNPAAKPTFAQAEQTFPELNLAIPTTFRSPPAQIAGITEAMVTNPVSVLQAAIAGQTITQTTVLIISSTSSPILGGGTANTAFLQGNPGKPNAVAAQVDAIFWIETVKGAAGKPNFHQLQYVQTVILNFNGLSWPHVTVGTLVQTVPKPISAKFIDPAIPADLLAKVVA